MRQIYNLLLILCALFFMASCQEENDALGTGGTGYLRLTVNGSSETTTKAANLPAGYTGEQIAVEIVDAEGKSVKSTNDWTEWEGEQIALPAGEYTIKAHSYGFDGKQSAMAAPYYYGSAEVTIENGKEVNQAIVCKLANVKMSVKIADDIKEHFNTFGLSVKAKDEKSCDPITFDIDLSAATVKDTAYFPVTDLVVSYSGQGKEGGSGSAEYELTEVKGNDHYILNFTLQDHGQGNVTVKVDPTMHVYEYTFVVSQHSTNSALLEANPWAKHAYLSASGVTTKDGSVLSNLKLQYRQKGAEDWTNLETTSTGEGEDVVYTATATSLTANTTYEYRLAGDNEFSTGFQEFTTEEWLTLYNGDFDDWYKSGNTWYAIAEKDYPDSLFWDSSNPGTTTGIGAMINKNPTQGNSTVVYTKGGSSAELKSQFASFMGMGKFAAASLYVGSFNSLEGANGAKIDFGKPFVSRPISLHGFFQYAPVAIDYVGDNQPDKTVTKGDDDVCSIFIALSKGPYQVDNTNVNTLLTEEKVKNSDQFIAYGELPLDQCVDTKEQWKEFNIPLKYKNLTDKPTHIIIVCTSSKYGDYFTGGNGSTMYVDDFSLIYDGEPTIWDLSANN